MGKRAHTLETSPAWEIEKWVSAPAGGGTVSGGRDKVVSKEDVCLESWGLSPWIFISGAGYRNVLTDESLTLVVWLIIIATS